MEVYFTAGRSAAKVAMALQAGFIVPTRNTAPSDILLAHVEPVLLKDWNASIARTFNVAVCSVMRCIRTCTANNGDPPRLPAASLAVRRIQYIPAGATPPASKPSQDADTTPFALRPRLMARQSTLRVSRISRRVSSDASERVALRVT